jgi:cbb3-type cytochrome oxidase subunit 3
MWKTWYLGNSFTEVALVSMVVFMTVFVAVVVWAVFTKKSAHDERACLPLLQDDAETSTPSLSPSPSHPAPAGARHG